MVSFIVPVYNTSQSDLVRCADSLLAQTEPNWECVFVNNGDREETSNALERIHQSDHRFIIIQADYKGVSHARNLGLSAAKGEYVSFCDADDTYKPNFLNNSLENITEYGLDLLVGGTEELINCEVAKKYTSFNASIRIYDEDQIITLIDYALASCSRSGNKELGNILLARVYPKLIKKEIANGVLFNEELHVHEDNLWCFEILRRCHRVGVVNECFYQYYVNPYSVTHRNMTEEYLRQEITFADTVRKFAAGKQDLEEAKTMRLLMIANNMLNILAVLKLDNQHRDHYLEEIVKTTDEQKIIQLISCYRSSKKTKALARILSIHSEKLRMRLLRQLVQYKAKRS